MPRPLEIVAPTIVRFTMKHLLTGGHEADTILDLSVDEVGTTRHDAVVGCVPTVRDAWQTRIIPRLDGNVAFTGMHYLDLDSTSGISGDLGPNAAKPITGSFNFSPTSPNVSYLCIKHCTHNRRQRSGRMYLPGVDEANVDSAGNVLGAYITGTNAVLESLRVDLTNVASVTHPATTAWRVVHVETYDGISVPGHPNGLPATWSSSDVSSVTVDGRVATQRRRLR
jgi:hypothetical protein